MGYQKRSKKSRKINKDNVVKIAGIPHAQGVIVREE